MPIRVGELKGNPLRHYRHFRRNPIAFLHETKKSGDIVRIPTVTGKPSYILHHPDFIRSVLAMEDTRIIKGHAAKVLGLTVGEGLLTSESDKHAVQRRQLQPAFRTENVEIIAKDILRLTDERIAEWGSHSSLYVTHELLDLTLDIVFEGLFGVLVGSERSQLHEVIEFAVGYSANRLMQSVPLPYWIPTKNNRLHRNAVQHLDEIVHRLLQQTENTPHKSVMQHILHMLDEHGHPISTQEIRDHIVTLIIAGHETSANLLNWMIYVLAKHPSVQEKLRVEVDSVLNSSAPDMQVIRKMEYLHQVIRETLRLYPPAWAIMRQNIEPFAIEDIVIPTGATLIIVPYSIHRNEVWFPEPEIFNPDRFLPTVEPTWPQFAYLPFGAGSRTCIGNRLAQTEIAMVMIRILQKYSWTVDTIHVEPEPSVSLRVKGGIHARFFSR